MNPSFKADLEFYEREWIKEHDARRAAEDKLNLLNDVLHKIRYERDAVADQVGALQQQLDAFKSESQRYKRLEQDLDLLKARIHDALFWKRDIAQPLAQELEAVGDVITAVAANSHPRTDWRVYLEDWHAEVLELTETLARGEGNETLAERTRGLVLAQWVFLRWLEIANLFKPA